MSRLLKIKPIVLPKFEEMFCLKKILENVLQKCRKTFFDKFCEFRMFSHVLDMLSAAFSHFHTHSISDEHHTRILKLVC